MWLLASCSPIACCFRRGATSSKVCVYRARTLKEAKNFLKIFKEYSQLEENCKCIYNEVKKFLKNSELGVKVKSKPATYATVSVCKTH